MSIFDSYLFNEDVTVGGKKLNDNGQTEDEQQGGQGNDSTTGGQGFGTPVDQSTQGTTGTTDNSTGDQSSSGSFGQPQTGGPQEVPGGTETGAGTSSTGMTPTATGAAEDDDDSDYTSMSQDDDNQQDQGANTPAAGDTGADENDYTQMQPDDQEYSAADDGNDTDYTQMTPDDDTQGNQFTAGTTGQDATSPADTQTTPDAAGGGMDATTTQDPTAGASEDQDDSDYTQMSMDDEGTGNNDQAGTDAVSQVDPGGGIPGDLDPPDTGATGPGGGTNDPGSGAAEEPDTDYGELSPDGDDSAGNNDGTTDPNNPDGGENGEGSEGSEDGASDDGSGAEGSDQESELKELEARLFSDLSPEQIQIKDNELKIQFIRLYEDIEKIENRVNRIVKTDANEEVVMFVSRKIEELKDLVHQNITQTYQTRSYLSNKIEYNHMLATFSSIGEMLKALSKKDKINDEKKDSDKDDLDNDLMVTSSDDLDSGS